MPHTYAYEYINARVFFSFWRVIFFGASCFFWGGRDFCYLARLSFFVCVSRLFFSLARLFFLGETVVFLGGRRSCFSSFFGATFFPRCDSAFFFGASFFSICNPLLDILRAQTSAVQQEASN